MKYNLVRWLKDFIVYVKVIINFHVNSFSEPLLSYSSYVDSMLIVADFKFFSNYNFLLRSDLDGFLTPGITFNLT